MLEILSQIGELVGGLGALIALIYLARQIRQSNVIVRAQSRQTLLDTASAGDWHLACDTDLLKAFAACPFSESVHAAVIEIPFEHTIDQRAMGVRLRTKIQSRTEQ
jgi:hypothetical protein